MGLGSDLVQDTRTHLDGATRGVLNELASDLDTVGTSFTLVREVGPIGPGAVLSVDLEDMYVWDYQASTKVVTVRRGINNTTVATHEQGGLVRVNPRFTDSSIFNAINQSFGALTSAGMFVPTEVQRTYTYLQTGLDLADDMVDDQVLQVSYQDLSGLKNWRELSGYQVNSNLLSSDYLSGKALFLDRGLPTGVLVRITYAARLRTLSALSDDVGTVSGLQASAEDLPALWAAIKLMSGQPVSRANPTHQPASRRTDEVSTGDVLNSMRGLQITYQRRVVEELRSLRSALPARERRFRL